MRHKKAKRLELPIPTLKSANIPTRFLFFDTETTPIITEDGKEIQDLKLGVAKYIKRNKNGKIIKSEELIFRTNIEIIEFIESHTKKKQRLLVYAHNIAFDLMVIDIFNHWHNSGIKIKPPIQKGMLFLWKVKHPSGNIEFVNTGNYCPYPLSQIGKDLGFEKLGIDFTSANDNELITYCRRDVEIIQTFILNFIQFLVDNELGSYKTTIASQALSVFRTKFMSEKIVIHNNLVVNTVERDAYLGGRTEAFYIGDVKQDIIYGLDVNSMYPFVMKQGNIPVEYRSFIPDVDIKHIDTILKNNYVIADVLIHTNKQFHAVRYNKDKHKIIDSQQEPRGRKLIFPIGTYRDYIHHDELIYALQNNLIIKIYGLYTYRSADVFSNYVDFFNTIKVKATQNENKSDRQIAKLYLNSLYGKFGQLFRDQQVIAQDVFLDIGVMDVFNENDDIEFTDFIWFNELWREYRNGESSYSFPAISGCITSRARLLLWQYIERAGLENVYYCDTDSLYTNEIGFSRLNKDIHPTRLGALDLEYELKEFVVNGAKDYIKDGERTVKGVPKNAMWLNDSVSISTRFEGWKEYRNRNMSHNPMVWQQLKIKNRPYDKGIVTGSGIVKPYTIVS